MNTRPMDAESCLYRLHQLALANVEALANEDDADRLQQQINQDHERIESVLAGFVILGDATDATGGDFSDCAQPPRLDLAMGALAVAMGTTTDPEVKPWLQTAIDFITGDYEPLESEDGSQSPVTSDGEVSKATQSLQTTEPKTLQHPLLRPGR